MAKTAKLTEKQQRFVEEYLIDLNATQAAIRAGYSAKTADQQGSRMLANVKVQQAISVAMAERSKRTGINQDRVVLELARIAFVKMTDLVDSHGRIKDNATDDDLACIESVKYKQSESETGSSVEREVKISPKLKALELLGKHLGMWNDKLDVNITQHSMFLGIRSLSCTRKITRLLSPARRKCRCLNWLVRVTVLFGVGKVDIGYARAAVHPRNQKQLPFGTSPI